MNAAVWHKYSDEVAKLATISIETGTPPDDLVNYGPNSLVDDNPARVAKIESTTGAWLFSYAAKQIIQDIGLIHHDFDAGANVKIQGNATNSWGTPAFSASITIPAWRGVGLRRWPTNPWLNLTTQVGYDATGFKFWRLVITGNSQNLQLGQVSFNQTLRRLDPDLAWNFQRILQKRYIENLTSYGVSTVYSRGTNEWRLDATHRMTDAMELSMVDQWFDNDGHAYPWMFVPVDGTNECFFVRWVAFERSHNILERGIIDHKFSVQEVSRGLRPGV